MAVLKLKSTMPTHGTNKAIALSPTIISALNARINSEEYSSRIYKAMYLWLEDKGYFNSAKLWNKFASEELNHADWAEQHLLSFDIKPELKVISQVPTEYEGLDDVIKKTLEHEMQVSWECAELSKLCLQENDMNTFVLAQKYVSEQTEEIRKAYDLVNLLNVYGTDKLALALLDHEIEKFL